MGKSTTGIEKIAASLNLIREMCKVQGYPDRLVVGDVLVPEQCMQLYMVDRVYHVTCQDITEPKVDYGEAKPAGMPMFTKQGCVQEPERRASRADEEDLTKLVAMATEWELPKPTLMLALAAADEILENFRTSTLGEKVAWAALAEYRFDMALDIAKVIGVKAV